MKTLKEYITMQKLTGESDLQIIKAYLIDNNMEEKGMEISHELAKSKIEKMKLREYIVKEWAYCIPSDYLYKNYSVDIATQLHRIELDYIVNGAVTESRLEWAKENVPNIKRPYCYFQPCIEWMENKGIKFAPDEFDKE